ncbi:uncharacterized protein LOC129591446 [Paramacrobiotus metropolitanus]|uniref:uncharacterized protein LOC129591446 n=1 Tax=Paramacrobiotus metropolitanus TaxID=2943436 RepID=UPI002445B0DA|nr:uncharacterized protein LOC129591446 [Paramacrobiotus metropolitanus]
MTGVPDNKKVNLLTDSLGPKPIKRIVAMCRPRKPTELSLTELVSKLQKQFTAYTFRKAQIAKFFQIKQQSGASLEDFAENLFEGTSYCSFSGTQLDDNMCAAFMNGLRNESTRAQLMSKDLQTFEETLDLASRHEAGQKEARRSSESSNTVNRVFQRRPFQKNSSDYKCRICGSRSHKRDECPHRDKRCNRCGRKGHLEVAWETSMRTNTIFTEEEFDVLMTY